MLTAVIAVLAVALACAGFSLASGGKPRSLAAGGTLRSLAIGGTLRSLAIGGTLRSLASLSCHTRLEGRLTHAKRSHIMRTADPTRARAACRAQADRTAPQTSLTSGPAVETTDTSASFTFRSSESNSSFECRRDRANWRRCASPRAYASLATGEHTFSVRARDAAGNVDRTPAGETWSITSEPPPDTSPPDTSITNGPAASTTNTSASFSFGSSEAGSSFACSLDGGAWASCSSPRAYSGLTLGAHGFSVRATDAAGNLDQTPARSDWVIEVPPPPPPDTTPPETSITSGPPATTTDTLASFSFDSSEQGSSFECNLDSGTWASCDSPWAYADLTIGTHSLSVRATDSAGNPDQTPARSDWTVEAPPPPDTTPPETSITSGPPATTTDTSASFSFGSSEAGSSFACSLDGGAWASCDSPWAYVDLTIGAHGFSVRATDSAGNVDQTPARSDWVIEVPPPPPPDTTPPETSITDGPPASTTSTSASFSFDSSEAGSSFACSLDGGAWASCSSPRAYSGLTLGAHGFSVRATDAAGNLDPSPAAQSWTIQQQTQSSSCTTTASSAAGVQPAINAAAAGSVICLADGSYGGLSLTSSKPVTVRAANPGAASIAGASLGGRGGLTLARFRLLGDVTVQTGSAGVSVDHNFFDQNAYNGYGVMACPSTSTTCDDISITNNRFVGESEEDTIRANRYHDGPDADSYGLLVEGNEFTGNVEKGGHNDVFQSVWVGDHLVFRKNYLHDFGGQGFFVKDQASAIDGLVAENNLIVRQNKPCVPNTLCPTWQLSPFQVYGPLRNVDINHNTVWPTAPGQSKGGGLAVMRNDIWTSASVSNNVFDALAVMDGISIASGSSNTRCTSGGGWPGPPGTTTDCTPAFLDPAAGDYRQASGRGVDWVPADQHYGP